MILIIIIYYLKGEMTMPSPLKEDLSSPFFFLLVAILFLLPAVSYAAHPLITDDTGTQGTVNYQIELNTELSSDKETGDSVSVKETAAEASSVFSYGLTDNTDIVLGVPYLWTRTQEDGDVTSEADGFGDMALELKWRFYEKTGLSLAVKPGITLPTGDEEKGLGSGKASYGLMLITTKEIGEWAFHLNLGYLRNAYKLEEDEDANRKDLYHASLASAAQLTEKLQAVANVGIERNPDKESDTHPAFILGGLIYSITDNIDVDFGVKGGLNKPETDLALLAGAAIRF